MHQNSNLLNLIHKQRIYLKTLWQHPYWHETIVSKSTAYKIQSKYKKFQNPYSDIPSLFITKASKYADI